MSNAVYRAVDFFMVVPEKSGEYECTIFANEIAIRNRELQNLFSEIELLVSKISKQQGYERVEQMHEELIELQNILAELSSNQLSTMSALQGGL